MKKLVYLMFNKLNISVMKVFPRASTKICKKIFCDKPLNVVEIGTMKGENAKSILKELNINKIYLIDPYENSGEYPNVSGDEEKAHKLLKNYKNKIIWIKTYSNKAIKLFRKEMDFIYIDGSHEYKQVKKDINNYWKLLNAGGVLAGHDICNHPGVSKAIIEFCYKNKLNPIFSGEDWIIVNGMLKR